MASLVVLGWSLPSSMNNSPIPHEVRSQNTKVHARLVHGAQLRGADPGDLPNYRRGRSVHPCQDAPRAFMRPSRCYVRRGGEQTR